MSPHSGEKARGQLIMIHLQEIRRDRNVYIFMAYGPLVVALTDWWSDITIPLVYTHGYNLFLSLRLNAGHKHALILPSSVQIWFRFFFFCILQVFLSSFSLLMIWDPGQVKKWLHTALLCCGALAWFSENVLAQKTN